MTLSEFKAWFEGFSEMMEGAPNEDQWKRVKARVAEITGSSVDRTVFFERYYRPYAPFWGGVMHYNNVNHLNAFNTNGTIDHGNGLKSQSTPSHPLFNSALAMKELGKVEYEASHYGVEDDGKVFRKAG